MPTPIAHIRDSTDGCLLTILARPRARRTEFDGIHDGALRIRVQAPPVDGKANAELVRFLAKKLGVPGSAVSLRRGERSQRKVIAIAGRTAADISRCISALQIGE